MPEVANALETVVRNRGAVMTQRGGVNVPAHFGSAAGELAACVLAVGMADRCDLAKLVLTGAPRSLGGLARRYLGIEPTPGGAVATKQGWWCAEAPDRLLVLAGAGLRPRLRDTLAAEGHRVGVSVSDASDTLASLAVAGRRMAHLLAALGLVPATGDLRSAAPYSSADVAGSAVHLLLESNHRALLITDARNGAGVWQSVETAGRPLGLSLIGIEALERFAMFDEMQRRAGVAV